jgi:hypothetical protein
MTQMVSTVRCTSVFLSVLQCELSDNHIAIMILKVNEGYVEPEHPWGEEPEVDIDKIKPTQPMEPTEDEYDR